MKSIKGRQSQLFRHNYFHLPAIMTSAPTSFDIEDIINEVLHLRTCDLLKLTSTASLEESLFEQILALDNHLLPMVDYIEWQTRIDRCCDILKNVIDTFHAIQMTVAKQRYNYRCDTASDDDEIDG